MDSQPKKRRRTSPRLSDRASNTDNDQIRKNAAATTTPPDPPPPRPSLSRPKLPSFASPTRASLARHNPEILERQKSMPRSEGERGKGNESMPDAQLSQSTETTRTDRLMQSEQHIRPLARSPVRSPMRSLMRSPERSLARSPTRSPTRTFGSMLSEPARRTPVKPVPRPLPPPDPQRSEDILQPLMARDKWRSGLDLFRTNDEQPEPELPPTPERPDPEMSTPPSGIHNSTPSKRPSKRRGRGKRGQPSSSSPLKQPPMKATPRIEPKVPAAAKVSKKMSATKETIAKPSLDQQRNGHAARGIRPPDPHAEKKDEREMLLAEIAELEADLSLVAAENERIRVAAETRSALSLPPNQRDIFRLLRRRALPLEAETFDATEDWLQVAMNPVAFLPFGKPSTKLTEVFTFGQSAAEDAEQEPPVSHHPIPMSAAEELPYLQAFSPLVLRSALVVLPQEKPDAPPLQKHLITATSTTHSGLFMARIEMIVHSKSLRITELSVPSMTPAAAAELQPLINRVSVSSQKEAGSALVRNVTVLLWAMGEWVRVATRRAKFWCALDRLVRDKEALRDAVQRLRISKKRKYNKRRNRGGGGGDGDNEDDDELSSEAPHRSGSSYSYSPAELLTHLGRTAMDVVVPLHQEAGAPAVRVLWSIGFDWTGEAQSDVGILLGVPDKWRKADEKGRLAGLPKLFDQLVRGDEDPETAVKTVVGLLAGDNDIV